MTLSKNLSSFLIWWTGVDKTIFEGTREEDKKTCIKHLYKAYLGLGMLAMLSTVLAILGTYSFILSSLRSHISAVIVSILVGMFMWGFDRSILGYISPNKIGSFIVGLIKLPINILLSSILTMPLAADVLISEIYTDGLKDLEDKLEKVDAKLDTSQARLDDRNSRLVYIRDKTKFGADKKINPEYNSDLNTAKKNVDTAEQIVFGLENQRKELVNKINSYQQRGIDYKNPDFSFSKKLQRILSSSEDIPVSDKIIAGAIFIIFSLLGSGAVLARTFFIGDDAYSKRWRVIEMEACHNAELKRAILKRRLKDKDLIKWFDAQTRDAFKEEFLRYQMSLGKQNTNSINFKNKAKRSANSDSKNEEKLKNTRKVLDLFSHLN